MAERASSPEERLLRLIRGQPTGNATATPAARTASRLPRAPRLPTATIVLVLNSVLGVLLIGCLIGVIWALMRPATLPPVAAAVPLELPPPPAEPPALDTQVFQRQLFQNPASAPEAPSADDAAAKQQAQAAMASLSLVGIVDGTPPQAIIADAQTQKSYFVKEGETFGPGVLVEHIAPGRVTVTFQGVQAELHL